MSLRFVLNVKSSGTEFLYHLTNKKVEVYMGKLLIGARIQRVHVSE